MGQPFGIWLVGLVGAAVVANGLFQFYRAFKSDLTDDLYLTDVGADHREWVTRIGRAGYAARGVAFVMIGGFLVAAAHPPNPGEAQGLDGALATLASQPFGPYLLGPGRGRPRRLRSLRAGGGALPPDGDLLILNISARRVRERSDRGRNESARSRSR